MSQARPASSLDPRAESDQYQVRTEFWTGYREVIMSARNEPELPPAVARLVRWDQQQAKAKFAEVVRRARGEGPQLVTTRGGKPVVVLAAEDYVALVERRPTSFLDLLVPGEELEPVRAMVPAEYEPVEL